MAVRTYVGTALRAHAASVRRPVASFALSHTNPPFPRSFPQRSASFTLTLLPPHRSKATGTSQICHPRSGTSDLVDLPWGSLISRSSPVLLLLCLLLLARVGKDPGFSSSCSPIPRLMRSPLLLRARSRHLLRRRRCYSQARSTGFSVRPPSSWLLLLNLLLPHVNPLAGGHD